jgi:hypothetical protein
MSEDFISGLQDDLVEAMDRYERRSPALGRLGPALGRLRPSPQTLAALAVVVALVAVVLAVARESDVERQAAPQPAPDKKGVVTDVGYDFERGVRFGLDGRVLTVQLLTPVRNQTFETVSGARISATCGAPPGDPRRETTVTRRWPDGQTSTSYDFPRDVASWCRLEDQSGSILAFVRFNGVPSGARELIAETADKWARHFASSPQTCTDYMSRTFCEAVKGCEPGLSIPACRAKARQWGEYFLGATAQRIAIRGDRAAATLSNDVIVQLRRTTTGEWQIDGTGPFGAVGPDAAAQRREHRGP